MGPGTNHCESVSVTVKVYQSLWSVPVTVKVNQSLCRCISYCEGVSIIVIVTVYQSMCRCTSHCESVPVPVRVCQSRWRCNHRDGVPVTVNVYWPLSGGVLVIVKAHESLWKLPRHVKVYQSVTVKVCQLLWRCNSLWMWWQVCTLYTLNSLWKHSLNTHDYYYYYKWNFFRTANWPCGKQAGGWPHASHCTVHKNRHGLFIKRWENQHFSLHSTQEQT